MPTGTNSQKQTRQQFNLDGKKISILLEWSDRGLTKIKLEENHRANSTLESRDEIRDLLKQLELYFSGKLKNFSFDWFDFSNCTEFQKKVYQAARQIHFGETKTYAQVATAIRQPKAVRAVGTALGKNPWILLVPCHRVKAKSGIGGFSAPGGIKTKLQLLRLES